MDQVFTCNEVQDALHRERQLFADHATEFGEVSCLFIDALLESGTKGDLHQQAQRMKELDYRPSAGSVASVAAALTRSARGAEHNQFESR